MTVPRAMYRFVSGRPLDGRDGYPYLSPGDGRWPGWKRQVTRFAVPVATAVTLADPQVAETGGAVLAAGLLYAVRRKWMRRRFDREYVTPTLVALSSPLGGASVKLHVDPGLGNLTPRLAKPLSPAETKVRSWYGARVEPVLRFVPERLWRSTRWTGNLVQPAVKPFRRPYEKPGPRIELLMDTPFLTSEQVSMVQAIVKAKIPVGDLNIAWNQVGPRVRAIWTVRKRPPAKVGYSELLNAFDGLKEWEFYLGAGPAAASTVISLEDDSPHIAESAGSGAGKSVLAQLIAVQVLRRGGHVTILDLKGSHKWAIGLPGVDYCHQPAQMHNALIRLAGLAKERNDLSFHEEEGWDPGPRELVICEELNATIGQLLDYWADVREKGDKKISPGITALRFLLYTGRSAKVHVLAIAQMLTARAIGGPEARENFAVRLLSRYTVNAWKMLAPSAAMPRRSSVRGRWQLVVGDEVTEVQVCFLTARQAHAFAYPVTGSRDGLDSGLTSDVAGNDTETGNKVDPMDVLVTLRDAIDEATVPWSKEATKMRLSRARRAGRLVPEPAGRRGLQTALFRRGDLVAWVESERVS